MRGLPKLDADLELAIAAARAAGKAVLRFFRQPHPVHYKAPDQPVTEADLLADGILKDALLRERPDYGWLSEETADSPARLSASRVWIVDPIDGTRSFVDGHPEFGISIGLVEEGVPRLGVVYNPASDELYHATAGGGAFRDQQPIRVSPAAGAAGGLILASRSEIRRGEFAPFAGDWRIEPLGSTAYKMVKVADGSGDLYLSRGFKSEWDVCAAALVVVEAGGRVTDLGGSDLRFNQLDPTFRGILVGNAEFHQRMSRQIAALPPGARLSAKEDE
ncbi:MAG TPA: 3'(2'),5'-bisphosphate nucleotidase CysQ [Longimicrobiaceae bacterium]|nr:3'(2'),5'-bisphosphate nucleotidase CysQ [Longimicrobiaceae bacterium]